MKKLLILLSIATIFSSCCNYKYNVYKDTSMKDKLISSSRFLVFPINEIDYQPATACFLANNSYGEGLEYQSRWNRELKENITTTFPKQKWDFIEDDSDYKAKFSSSLSELYAHSLSYNRTEIVDVEETDELVYADLPEGERFDYLFTKLREDNKTDYIVFFVKPKLLGSIDVNYSNNGSSYTTKYTADLLIQIWNVKTGKMMLNTGVKERRQGWCFFISPQDNAINAASDSMMKNMNFIIANWIDKTLQKEYLYSFNY